MSDGISNQFTYWGSPGEEEQGWDGYLASFSMKPKAARIYDLEQADTWLAEQTVLSREHAALVSKKRELLSIHRKLQELGR
jgi:hypothetical protein